MQRKKQNYFEYLECMKRLPISPNEDIKAGSTEGGEKDQKRPKNPKDTRNQEERQKNKRPNRTKNLQSI